MLVLSRKTNEVVVIDTPLGQMRVKVIEIRGGKVRLGFDGDRRLHIRREELVPNDRCVLPVGSESA